MSRDIRKRALWYVALTACFAAACPAAAAHAGAADGDWIPASGSAIVMNNLDRATASAQRDALARALAQYLQTWLDITQLQNQESLVNHWFFSHPEQYVAELTDTTARHSGNHLYWSSRVRFDETKVLHRLETVGLISPWDQQPELLLTPAAGETLADAGALTETTWYEALHRAGIHVILAATPPTHTTIYAGRLTFAVTRTTVADPFEPDVKRAVTDAVIAGTIGAASYRIQVRLAPRDGTPPAQLAGMALVSQIFDRWIPQYTQALQKAQWTLGDLAFPDARAWAAFDGKLFAQRSLFHSVHPVWMSRHDGRLWVRYAFFLQPDDVENAVAWLMNQNFNFHVTLNKAAQQFVVSY